MKAPDIKSRVLSVIRHNPTPIYQIAKEADVSIATASKYCHILQAENKVVIQNFGNMKLVKRR